MKSAPLNLTTIRLFDFLQDWRPFQKLAPDLRENIIEPPTFTADFFKPFQFFSSNPTQTEATDRSYDTGSKVHDSGTSTAPSNIGDTGHVMTVQDLVSLGVLPQTIDTLTSYGLNPTDIYNLFTAQTSYYDKEIKSGRHAGARLFVKHLPPEDRPNATEVKNNITDDGRYDGFLRYPNIGFSFMVKVDGVDYLFNQTYRSVTGFDVRMCYLVSMTTTQNQDGSFAIHRKVVSDTALQQKVMQRAVDSGVLQQALNRVEKKERLIESETRAQAYADLVLAGGAVYGFSGTVSGSMSKYIVTDVMTPDGFVFRLTDYRHSSGANFTKTIGSDKVEYNDYIATNYATFGLQNY